MKAYNLEVVISNFPWNATIHLIDSLFNDAALAAEMV
jgi:hypothetical protein